MRHPDRTPTPARVKGAQASRGTPKITKYRPVARVCLTCPTVFVARENHHEHCMACFMRIGPQFDFRRAQR